MKRRLLLENIRLFYENSCVIKDFKEPKTAAGKGANLASVANEIFIIRR